MLKLTIAPIPLLTMAKISKITNKLKEQNKEQIFAQLIKNAPKYFTIETLCEGVGVTAETYYVWTKNLPDIRKQINDNLAEKYAIRSQESEDGSVEITINLRDARMVMTRPYSKEQKTDITDMVCYAYEKGVSIAVSCKALKVDDSTFYNWANPDSPNYFAYTYERLKLSREIRKMAMKEADTFTARVALGNKLKDRKVTNVTRYYEAQGLDGEQSVLKSYTEHERVLTPELQAIALVLNNLDPEFNKATAGGQMMDDKDYRYMSDEDLEAELKVEQEREEILNGTLNDSSDSSELSTSNDKTDS